MTENRMFDTEVTGELHKQPRRSGSSPPCLLAVAEVESGGKVFATVRGRREPLIRFEGHYFDRRLSGGRLTLARQAGLASPWPAVSETLKPERPLDAAWPRGGDRPCRGARVRVVGARPGDGRALELARLRGCRGTGGRGAARRDGPDALMCRFIEKAGLVRRCASATGTPSRGATTVPPMPPRISHEDGGPLMPDTPPRSRAGAPHRRVCSGWAAPAKTCGTCSAASSPGTSPVDRWAVRSAHRSGGPRDPGTRRSRRRRRGRCRDEGCPETVHVIAHADMDSSGRSV